MKTGRQTKLLHSLLKYGFQAHTVEILHTCTPAELNSWEIYFIDVYDCFNTDHGLNLKAGGHSGGTLSEESKNKLRKPKSSEAKEKYRRAALNRVVSVETREKHRQRMLGNKHLIGRRLTKTWKPIYMKDGEGLILMFLSIKDCQEVVKVHEDSIRKAIKLNRMAKGKWFSLAPFN